MSWALRGIRGAERLVEYEARLNDFFPTSRCLGLCLYDRRRFPPEILLDILHIHPGVFIGGILCRNAFYVEPTLFLRNQAGARLDQRLRSLVETQQGRDSPARERGSIPVPLRT